MKIPGPGHPITIDLNPNRVTVRFHGRTIADTRHALMLREASLPPVHYIPREDVHMAHLRRTDRQTRCPYKGDAAYWSVDVDGRSAENAVWSYEAPFPAVADIKDHMAFYADRMDSIEETAG